MLKKRNVLIGQNQALPNISGSVSFLGGNEAPNISSASGTFATTGSVNYANCGSTVSGYSRKTGFNLDASRSNATYGRSNEVITNNFTKKVWVRTA